MYINKIILTVLCLLCGSLLGCASAFPPSDNSTHTCATDRILIADLTKPINKVICKDGTVCTLGD